jgi:hypothetical protein
MIILTLNVTQISSDVIENSTVNGHVLSARRSVHSCVCVYPGSVLTCELIDRHYVLPGHDPLLTGHRLGLRDDLRTSCGV